ncbi:MAG TPA: uracil-DNA glycosylase family protein [Verrucomicrobiae bacterium]|nr:uracil-DNA glycosylase family protein [Verrucomicrobiae bacterium]
MPDVSQQLIRVAQKLARDLDTLRFPAPVAYVYNPLRYAWRPHAEYLKRYGARPRRVLFLGMNPGPFGMAQTGIPFGEVTAVRDWLGITGPVGRPPREHPRKPVHGFHCPRSEVSGRRLWGLFAARFKTPADFFAEHFVYNYCPLLFLEAGAGGKNLTPDRLPGRSAERLFMQCDEHLRRVVDILNIEVAIGVGGFAEQRLRATFPEARLKIGRILHPSPASPAANRDWAGTATRELRTLGVWR